MDPNTTAHTPVSSSTFVLPLDFPCPSPLQTIKVTPPPAKSHPDQTKPQKHTYPIRRSVVVIKHQDPTNSGKCISTLVSFHQKRHRPADIGCCSTTANTQQFSCECSCTCEAATLEAPYQRQIGPGEPGIDMILRSSDQVNGSIYKLAAAFSSWQALESYECKREVALGGGWMVMVLLIVIGSAFFS